MKVFRFICGRFKNTKVDMKFLFILIIIASFLSACLVGPSYNRPETSPYTNYTDLDSAKKDSVSLIAWTEVYKDTVLTKLIRNVLDSNLDVLTAVARVEESRALYGFSKSFIWPSVGYDLSAGANDLGNNAKEAGVGINNESFHGFATMNWEIDLFGKLSHQKRSSWAQFLAEENNAQAVRVSLIAETATLYFVLRDLDNRLEIAKQTVQSRTESLKIISERFDKGYVAELDKLQAQQQLSIVEALVPNLERQIIFTQNALRVLTGMSPGDIPRGLSNYDQQLPPEIPAGLPSDLLERRPDIIAAEQQLVSQTEEIGVATSLRFPTISLTGFLGFASPQLSTIVDPESFAMGVGGGLFGPVFEFGKNKRRVEVRRAQAMQFSFQYQKTVIKAFAEVDNSLASLRTYKVEHAAYATELAAASRAFTLTQARYDEGYSDYLELLNQQDNLFEAQLNESITQSRQNIAVVELFKALGGGWNAK
jgi:outer membrane protein, multidrug efflux system